MRMWNINPRILCRRHLLGEHLEMHMFKGTFEKGKSIEGYLERGLVNLGQIKTRHDELVKEMIKRGFNHKSPMQEFKEHNENKNIITVDSIKNKLELANRCKDCKKLQEDQ
jgi:hypothetical protein